MHKIIQSTISCCLQGAFSFSPEQIAEQSSVPYPTLCDAFPTKASLLTAAQNWTEDVLFSPYLSRLLSIHTSTEARSIWLLLLDHLMTHRNETLFYALCTDSACSEADAVSEYVTVFAQQIELCKIYICDISALYAKKLLLGLLPDSTAVRSSISILLSEGLCGLMR